MKISADSASNVYERTAGAVHQMRGEKGSESLENLILSVFPERPVEIHLNHALNCFYAELGGILDAFENYECL